MTVAEVINRILSVCGGISIIGGALAVLWKWVRPVIKLKSRVESLENHVKTDYDTIGDIKKMQSEMCRALISIIDHNITGNHIDGLKETKKALINIITESV